MIYGLEYMCFPHLKKSSCTTLTHNLYIRRLINLCLPKRKQLFDHLYHKRQERLDVRQQGNLLKS